MKESLGVWAKTRSIARFPCDNTTRVGRHTPPVPLCNLAVWFGVSTSDTICLRIITARCTLVQSAVLRSHVVCLSVRLSATLVDCDHIGWNSSKIISRLVSLGCSLSADPSTTGLHRVREKTAPLNKML